MDQPVASSKVLIAPLDWGLGHATRCVPIIRELIAQNCTVVVAASGKVKALLELEFPHLIFLDLPGYEIEYASSAWELPLKIVAQIPKLLAAIKSEEAWLKKIVDEEKIDVVISDNRYGLHHSGIKTVFITHQLLIKAPIKLAEDFLQEINYKYIDQFDECWVPDAEGETNLAGILSHPLNKPKVPLLYIGPLSRFRIEAAIDGDYLLIILSGPEPQRTLLEEILINDLKEYKKRVIIVRGLPQNPTQLNVADNVTVFDHLAAAELEQKIKGASFVISRCGYSTVMDLAALKKRSILVPTPGQTEQEYLAKHLMQMNFAFCVEQKKFRLTKVLELAAAFQYQFVFSFENKLQAAISSLLKISSTQNYL